MFKFWKIEENPGSLIAIFLIIIGCSSENINTRHYNGDGSKSAESKEQIDEMGPVLSSNDLGLTPFIPDMKGTIGTQPSVNDLCDLNRCFEVCTSALCGDDKCLNRVAVMSYHNKKTAVEPLTAAAPVYEHGIFLKFHIYKLTDNFDIESFNLDNDEGLEGIEQDIDIEFQLVHRNGMSSADYRIIIENGATLTLLADKGILHVPAGTPTVNLNILALPDSVEEVNEQLDLIIVDPLSNGTSDPSFLVHPQFDSVTGISIKDNLSELEAWCGFAEQFHVAENADGGQVDISWNFGRSGQEEIESAFLDGVPVESPGMKTYSFGSVPEELVLVLNGTQGRVKTCKFVAHECVRAKSMVLDIAGLPDTATQVGTIEDENSLLRGTLSVANIGSLNGRMTFPLSYHMSPYTGLSCYASYVLQLNKDVVRSFEAEFISKKPYKNCPMDPPGRYHSEQVSNVMLSSNTLVIGTKTSEYTVPRPYDSNIVDGCPVYTYKDCYAPDEVWGEDERYCLKKFKHEGSDPPIYVSGYLSGRIPTAVIHEDPVLSPIKLFHKHNTIAATKCDFGQIFPLSYESIFEYSNGKQACYFDDFRGVQYLSFD